MNTEYEFRALHALECIKSEIATIRQLYAISLYRDDVPIKFLEFIQECSTKCSMGPSINKGEPE